MNPNEENEIKYNQSKKWIQYLVISSCSFIGIGLFLSVILQALLDATSKKSKVNKDRAISWFFCSVGVTCDNFEQICQHAGLSPSYTRSFAYKVIHSPDIKYVRQRIKKML